MSKKTLQEYRWNLSMYWDVRLQIYCVIIKYRNFGEYHPLEVLMQDWLHFQGQSRRTLNLPKRVSELVLQKAHWGSRRNRRRARLGRFPGTHCAYKRRVEQFRTAGKVRTVCVEHTPRRHGRFDVAGRLETGIIEYRLAASIWYICNHWKIWHKNGDDCACRLRVPRTPKCRKLGVVQR